MLLREKDTHREIRERTLGGKRERELREGKRKRERDGKREKEKKRERERERTVRATFFSSFLLPFASSQGTKRASQKGVENLRARDTLGLFPLTGRNKHLLKYFEKGPFVLF